MLLSDSDGHCAACSEDRWIGVVLGVRTGGLVLCWV
jgi:hypothetical protein